MKLNIGSGLKRIEGYLNVDSDPLVYPDFIVDLESAVFPWGDNTVEAVVAHHIFEHIGDNFLIFMKELYRVCTPGAIIDIEVPHHRHENWYGDPTHRRPITVELLRKFSKKYNNWHIETYNSSRGFGNTLDVDFEIVEFDYIVDGDYMDLVKAGEYQQLHELAKRFNNVYSDLRIKLAVIKDE